MGFLANIINDAKRETVSAAGAPAYGGGEALPEFDGMVPWSPEAGVADAVPPLAGQSLGDVASVPLAMPESAEAVTAPVGSLDMSAAPAVGRADEFVPPTRAIAPSDAPVTQSSLASAVQSIAPAAITVTGPDSLSPPMSAPGVAGRGERSAPLANPGPLAAGDVHENEVAREVPAVVAVGAAKRGEPVLPGSVPSARPAASVPVASANATQSVDATIPAVPAVPVSEAGIQIASEVSAEPATSTSSRLPRAELAAEAVALPRPGGEDEGRAAWVPPRAEREAPKSQAASVPQVHIGRVDIVVMAPEPAPRQAAAPTTSDLASRLYLRRL